MAHSETPVADPRRDPRHAVRVYIAGPYSKGDVGLNVKNAVVAGEAVLRAGHDPYIPHLNHLWHLLFPGSYGQWLRLDVVWLRQCEVLIRLPGESAGADAEVEIARAMGLPVFYGVSAFLGEQR
jgi:uncharacterized protein DUF4406